MDEQFSDADLVEAVNLARDATGDSVEQKVVRILASEVRRLRDVCKSSTRAPEDAAELDWYRRREGDVHDLMTASAEALSKLESLRGHVREGLVESLRSALEAVRGAKP
jgi:hypothetical protein